MSTIRVLVVDDSDEIRSVVSQMVVIEEGLEIVGEASNGKDAIEMAEILHPDVILMDIQMPVMDGITATKTIRGLPDIKQPKIVYVTAFADDLHRDEARNSGADSFISKPIDREILLSILDDGPDDVIDTSISPS